MKYENRSKSAEINQELHQHVHVGNRTTLLEAKQIVTRDNPLYDTQLDISKTTNRIEIFAINNIEDPRN